jgi:hypothetical protein
MLGIPPWTEGDVSVIEAESASQLWGERRRVQGKAVSTRKTQAMDGTGFLGGSGNEIEEERQVNIKDRVHGDFRHIMGTNAK